MIARFLLLALLGAAPWVSGAAITGETIPVGFAQAGSGYAAQMFGSAVHVDARGATIRSGTSCVRFELLGAHPQARIRGEGDAGVENRFVGRDPRNWKTGIALAKRVVVIGALPGVVVIWQGHGSQLEYDFQVAPGAHPQAIALALHGARSLTVDAQGNLRIATADGDLVQHRPVSYQIIGGKRREVESRFQVGADQTIRFAIAKYDPFLPLTIDPVVGFSSYLGGTGIDEGHAATVDAQGDFYLAGVTYSTKLSNGNVLLLKVPPSGSPVRSVFGGTTGNDSANAVVTDSSGNVYLAGSTSSTDFPLSGALPIQSQIFTTGTTKAFLTGLTPDNSTLLLSGFFGGSYSDSALAMTIGSDNYLRIAGSTTSPDFLADFVATNVFQYTNHGGTDGFLLAISTQGVFAFATYVGGSGDDFVNAVTIDSTGGIYLAGATSSNDFPVGPGRSAFQNANHGNTDAFAMKLYPDGTLAYWSTYMGGADADAASGIVLDSKGNLYVAGTTGSKDFPTLTGVHQKTYAGGGSDGFVLALQNNGQGLWGTFLGSTGADAINGIALDANGGIYLIGTTDGTDFPVTSDALQSKNAGKQDVTVSKLTNSGTSLLFSSYFGGTGNDIGTALALDSVANIYFTGITASSNNDFPVSQGAYQPKYGGGSSDAFFAVFGCPNVLPVITSQGVVSAGSYSPNALAPGSLISIFGTNLSCTAGSALSVPLPVAINGTSVQVNGKAIPLVYVSEGQVNAQLPYEATIGSNTMLVISPAGKSSSITIPVLAAAPGLFAITGKAIVLNQDGTLNSTTNGAKPGTVVTVFFTGQGPLDNPIATGAAALASPLSRVALTNSATIGGANAPVYFMGMTPGSVGLAQANLTVPPLSSGDQPVVLTIAGLSSTPATVTVTN